MLLGEITYSPWELCALLPESLSGCVKGKSQPQPVFVESEEGFREAGGVWVPRAPWEAAVPCCPAPGLNRARGHPRSSAQPAGGLWNYWQFILKRELCKH